VISPSDTVFISELCLILERIGQWNVKHILTLLIKSKIEYNNVHTILAYLHNQSITDDKLYSQKNLQLTSENMN